MYTDLFIDYYMLYASSYKKVQKWNGLTVLLWVLYCDCGLRMSMQEYYI